MRQDLEALETKAKYWKAEYEVRYYTLEAEKLQEEYDKWLEKQKEVRAKLQQDLLEQQKKNIEAGLVAEGADLTAKPEEVENA